MIFICIGIHPEYVSGEKYWKDLWRIWQTVVGKEMEIRQADTTEMRIHPLVLGFWAVQASLGELTWSHCLFLLLLYALYIAGLLSPTSRWYMWHHCCSAGKGAGGDRTCPAQLCHWEAFSIPRQSLPAWQAGKGCGSAPGNWLLSMISSSLSLPCHVWSYVCDHGNVCYKVLS